MKALWYLHAAAIPATLVVRAACETCARSVAAENAGKEGPAVWRDREQSTCRQIQAEGRSGVILRREG